MWGAEGHTGLRSKGQVGNEKKIPGKRHSSLYVEWHPGGTERRQCAQTGGRLEGGKLTGRQRSDHAGLADHHKDLIFY